MAVKWLAPGQTPQPLANPFIVSVLPITQDPNAPGNHEKIANLIRFHLNYPLETKGFYVLPGWASAAGGSLSPRGDASTANLPASNFLLEINFTSQSESYMVVAAESRASIGTRLLRQPSLEAVFDSSGIGKLNTASAAMPYMSPALMLAAAFIAPNARRREAAMQATLNSLIPLKVIAEEAGPCIWTQPARSP